MSFTWVFSAYQTMSKSFVAKYSSKYDHSFNFQQATIIFYGITLCFSCVLCALFIALFWLVVAICSPIDWCVFSSPRVFLCFQSYSHFLSNSTCFLLLKKKKATSFRNRYCKSTISLFFKKSFKFLVNIIIYPIYHRFFIIICCFYYVNKVTKDREK